MHVFHISSIIHFTIHMTNDIIGLLFVFVINFLINVICLYK